MSAGVPAVLPDANVLYSRTLRDWICLLANRSGSPLFHLHWTEDILGELVYHLRKKHPDYSDQQVGGVRDRIVDVAVHGRISGYDIDPDFTCTDECDNLAAHLESAQAPAFAAAIRKMMQAPAVSRALSAPLDTC